MAKITSARKRHFQQSSNRHPIDRLAELREAERDIKQQIEETREEILANAHDLEGDEYIGSIDHRPYTKADIKALIRDFGAENKYLTRGIAPWILTTRKGAVQ